jgi:integrase
MSKKKVAGRKRLWRVYPLGDGRWAIKYYITERRDDQVVERRSEHRIPVDLSFKIRTPADAERFAEAWYKAEVKRVAEEANKKATRALATAGVEEGLTFEQFASLWTSGELAKKHPDHVRAKKSAKDDKSRLKIHITPIIGNEPLAAFEGPRGLELAEKVMAALPPPGPAFSKDSRRHVAQIIHRLLVMAVYPAKLLKANPLPKGFLPKKGPVKAKSYIYPDEDAKLLAFKQAPVLERLFFGFLAREGARINEVLSLTWSDIDLERGVLVLDEDKCDDPRSWAMSPGVAEALRRWRKQFVPDAPLSTPIFSDKDGKLINHFECAENLREYLKAAGIARPQLFEDNEARKNLRAHDLRATFVTVNLALGKTEAWVTDRTGHKSSQMIYTYKRSARMHVELNLGDLKPLHEAIPELAGDDTTALGKTGT